VENINVAVKELEGEVVFLHQIVAGAADKSYGIHVAQLAGVPRKVNERAKEILAELESQGARQQAEAGKRSSAGQPRRVDNPPAPVRNNGQAMQMTLFETADHPLLDTIRGADLNNLTPLEVQQLVSQWQAQLAGLSLSKPR